jgi:hypothetical protein
VANLPIQFNLNVRAPFYSLLGTYKSMYDPSVVKDPRTIGLLDARGRSRVPQPGTHLVPPSVAPVAPFSLQQVDPCDECFNNLHRLDRVSPCCNGPRHGRKRRRQTLRDERGMGPARRAGGQARWRWAAASRSRRPTSRSSSS